MNIYQFLKCGKEKDRIFSILKRSILILVILAFGFSNTYAQHLFSVSYNDLSQENARQINAQVERSRTSIVPLTKNISGEYAISLSADQNTKIIILNEETGSNVVIAPTKAAPTEFVLPPFFIEELRQAALGDADRFLMIEAGTDFSIRSTMAISRTTEEVLIPRFFYGPKENVKEALPKDRQIIHIFKERPRLIPAYPNDPENLRFVAQLEEEMSYYVYMYKLPDGTLIIFDEHFIIPSAEQNEVRTGANTTATNLQFNLSGNLNVQQQVATLHAIDLWSER